MKYKYHICDVFTDIGGNQLAVLPEAEGLSSAPCRTSPGSSISPRRPSSCPPSTAIRAGSASSHPPARSPSPDIPTWAPLHPGHGGGNRARRTENQDPLRGKSGAGRPSRSISEREACCGASWPPRRQSPSVARLPLAMRRPPCPCSLKTSSSPTNRRRRRWAALSHGRGQGSCHPLTSPGKKSGRHGGPHRPGSHS